MCVSDPMRTTVRRHPERGRYDRATIEEILDEALYCHIGFVDNGQPYVVPTMYARDDDRVIVHGSTASRMVRVLRSGAPVCLTVSLLDGLVLARSANAHSLNYRSVVVLGSATAIDEREPKVAAMRALVDRMAPGRWASVRPPSDKELRATAIFAVPLDEASAKIRTGPPIDDESDLGIPVWAGVVPLAVAAGTPQPDAAVDPSIAPGADVSAILSRGVRAESVVRRG